MVKRKQNVYFLVGKLALTNLFLQSKFIDGCLFFQQDEWTGEQKLQYTDIPEDIEPEEIRPMGNYAVQITWPDGFNQVNFFCPIDKHNRFTVNYWFYYPKERKRANRLIL